MKNMFRVNNKDTKKKGEIHSAHLLPGFHRIFLLERELSSKNFYYTYLRCPKNIMKTSAVKS